MLERLNPVLKWLCFGIACLILYQVSRIATQKSPLKDLKLSNLAAVTEANPSSVSTNGNATNNAVSPAKPPTPIPPMIEARVERIKQTEILGQIIRPMPMALMGIAGKEVFLRAPNGQTGMVKEGDELGGVKILQVGTNRVLVEQDSQKKELMLFSGFGSETLLPKGKDNP